MCENHFLLKIDDIFQIACLKLNYKSAHNRVSNYIYNQLLPNSNVHEHVTRQQNDIHATNIKTYMEKQLINFKISNTWNKMPNSIKLLSGNISLKGFTKHVKAFLLSSYSLVCQNNSCYVCNNA